MNPIKLTVKFVGTVASNGRLHALSKIISAFLAEHARRRGERRAGGARVAGARVRRRGLARSARRSTRCRALAWQCQASSAHSRAHSLTGSTARAPTGRSCPARGPRSTRATGSATTTCAPACCAHVVPSWPHGQERPTLAGDPGGDDEFARPWWIFASAARSSSAVEFRRRSASSSFARSAADSSASAPSPA